jgi:GAF domain-containing protein/CheY-like chemotaxis protein
MRREAALLAHEPAIIEGATRSDWATLARGASPRMLSLTLDRLADLVLVLDVAGTPIVQVPATPRAALPALPPPAEPVARLGLVGDRAYVLGFAPLPAGTVVVGRRFESLARALTRLPSRPAAVVLVGDRALGVTEPGLPTAGWAAATRAGTVTFQGRTWLARPLDGAGPGGAWALIPDDARAAAARRFLAWWGVSLGVVAAGVLGSAWTGGRGRTGRGAAAGEGRPRRQLEALYAVAHTMGSGDDLAITAEQTLDVVCSVARIAIGGVFRLDEADQTLTLVAHRGLSPDDVERLRVRPLDQSHVGEAVRTGRYVITELPRSRVLTPEVQAQVRTGGYQTQLALPIPVNGRTWGVMALISREPRTWDGDELTLLQAVAHQVGLAVARAGLFAETREKSRRLEALTRLAQTLTATLSLDEVFQRVVGSAVELFGSSVARLWLLDDDGEHVTLGAAAGAQSTVEGIRRFRAGEGLIGAVIASRSPLTVADVLGDPRTRNAERIRAEGTVSVAIVPLLLGARALGALSIGVRERHVYTAEELSVLHSLALHAANAINNARLFTEERTRRAYLAALLEINTKIGSLAPTEALLSSIAEEAARLLGVDNAGFRLVEGDELVVAGLAGSAAETMARSRLRIGESLSGRVVATGRTLVADIEDVVPPEHLAAARRLGYTTYLGVPLRVGDRIIGVLTFRARRAFDARDCEMAEVFAGQAAIALEHSRLYRESGRQAERMTALAGLGRLLSETLDFDRVAQRVADSVCTLLGARSSCLYRLEPDGGVVAVTVSSEAGASFQWAGALRPGEGIAGLAVGARRPVATEDAVADPRLEYPADMRTRLAGETYRGLLAVPLAVQDRLLGALVVSDRAGRRFDPQEIDLAQAFADQAALALENARLYSATERRLEDTRALLEVVEILNSTLDSRQLLKRAAIKIAQVCRVDRCTLELWEGGQVTPLMSQFADGRRDPAQWAAFQAAARRPLLEIPANALARETRRPVVVDDTTGDTLMPRDWIEAFGLQSYLVVPMIRQDQVIGVMTLDRCERPAPFEPWQVDRAMTIAGELALSIENTRLYTEAQERLRETTTLLAVGQILSRPGPTGERVRQVAREVARALGADMVGSYFLDERKEALVPLGGYHVPRELLERFMSQPIVLAKIPDLLPVWREGRAAWSSDPHTDSRFDSEWMRALPPHSVLFASATARGEPIGALFVVWWRPGRRFLPAEIRLLEGVAAQLGLAMENAELARQTEIKLRETETLLSVSRALSSTVNLEALLRHFLRSVTRAVEADSAGAWLRAGDDEWLEPVAGYQIPPERLAALRGLRVSLARHAFYAEAARTKRPVSSSHVAEDPRLADVMTDALPHRSQLFVPVVVKDRVIGGFGLIWLDRVREFSPGEIALMEAIANQAGVAIENARLFEENRRQVGELSVLHELSRAVTGQLDRAALVDAIRAQVARVLDARNMLIALRDEDRGDFEVILRVVDGALEMRPPLRYPPRSVGLMSVVFETGRPMRTDDYLAECARSGVEPAPGAVPLRYWLGVPMLAGRVALGVLALRSGERPFTEADERLLSNIADLGALALRSARLFEERARAYGELAAAQDQLVRTEKLRALGEMASGVAHDFNNLLASILGRAQLVLQRVADPQLRQWLQVVERAALDGAATVRRLQDFTRIRRDQPFVAVDLNEVVRDALEITQSRWREEPSSRGVSIEVRTSLGAPPRVAGDPAELREALTNLILNAVDAMPAGGALSLATAAEDGGAAVSVGDTGVGIPEGIRERIFDPFFTTKGPQGTGLGLSITYGIVQRHGGRIAVESEAGRGTTFRLRFPATATLPAAEAPAAEPADKGASLRCLVVDDEPAVGAMLGDVLRIGGHHAVVLDDGGEAIARFGAELFDIVFTDLAMPRVSGWQVARAIKEMAPAVPVFLVTGFGVELTEEERRAHGVDLVLVKPLKIQEILDAVAQAARRRAHQTRTEEQG